MSLHWMFNKLDRRPAYHCWIHLFDKEMKADFEVIPLDGIWWCSMGQMIEGVPRTAAGLKPFYEHVWDLGQRPLAVFSDLPVEFWYVCLIWRCTRFNRVQPGSTGFNRLEHCFNSASTGFNKLQRSPTLFNLLRPASTCVNGRLNLSLRFLLLGYSTVLFSIFFFFFFFSSKYL